MHYVILARDKPGSADLRAATRPAHLEFLAQHAERLKTAGPLLDDSSDAPVGTLLIVTGESLDAVRAWAGLDPYAQAGLFESVEVKRFRWLFGAPE